ncbi:MAG: hypothetical protein ACK5LC_18295 [Coprobacillaceae bacterium]
MMSFINWISISITIILLIITLTVTIYYRKKIRDLDGFMGIVKEDPKNQEIEDDF